MSSPVGTQNQISTQPLPFRVHGSVAEQGHGAKLWTVGGPSSFWTVTAFRHERCVLQIGSTMVAPALALAGPTFLPAAIACAAARATPPTAAPAPFELLRPPCAAGTPLCAAPASLFMLLSHHHALPLVLQPHSQNIKHRSEPSRDTQAQAGVSEGSAPASPPCMAVEVS